MPHVSERDLERVRTNVRERYANSGQPPEVVKALDEHNDRVYELVEGLAADEGLDEDDTTLLKTIAILHDAAKADTHLMLHAEAGAQEAADTLRELGADEEFIVAVQRGIRCHMGPFPFVEEEAQKYAERTGEQVDHPRPESRIEKLFYDADMLALMDIEGMEKVVVLRSTTPEFIEEDEQTSEAEGVTPRMVAYRSALKSVQRAAATLFSDSAKRRAARLMEEAERHVSRITAEEEVKAS